MPCQWQDISGQGDYVWICTEHPDAGPLNPGFSTVEECVEFCGGPVPPTPIRTELTCFATPDTVPVGEKTNVYGVLRGVDTGAGVPGQPVRLYRKRPGEDKFSYVRYAWTDGGGGYIFKNELIDREGTSIFFAWFQGTETIMASISPEVSVVGYVTPPVKTKTSLTLLADKTVIPKPPGNVTLSGALTRKDTGAGLSKIIDLYQQKPGGTFQLVAKPTTAYGTGVYVSVRELTEPGVHNFYTTFTGDVDYEESISPTVSVGVEEEPPDGPPEIDYSLIVTVGSILAGAGLIGLSRKR